MKALAATLARVIPPGFSNDRLTYRICSVPDREHPFVHGVGGVVGNWKRIRITSPAAASAAGSPAGTVASIYPVFGSLPGTYSVWRSHSRLAGLLTQQSLGR